MSIEWEEKDILGGRLVRHPTIEGDLLIAWQPTRGTQIYALVLLEDGTIGQRHSKASFVLMLNREGYKPKEYC